MSIVTIDDPAQIYELLRRTLATLFEIDPARVSLETRLFDELEIDSIDAVDLILQLERTIGRKISAEDFHSVRTVADLVQAIARVQQQV